MNKVEILPNGNVRLTIPMSFRNCAGRKRIVTPEVDAPIDDPLIITLARAFRWQALIDAGKFANALELARYIGKDETYVTRALRLTLLAPGIVHAILTGNAPKSIRLEQLRKPIPVLWDEQKKLYGMD